MVTWSKKWIHPYESPWSILEKFTLVNVITKGEVLNKLGNNAPKNFKRNKYNNKYGDILTLGGFNHSMLRSFLDYDLKAHNSCYIDLTLGNIRNNSIHLKEYFYPKLRWCPMCMAHGVTANA